jgi:hypothetical protein
MKKFTVKVYPAVVLMEGVEYSVDIGIVDKGVPFEAFYDSWIDPRIYYTIEDHELDDLKAGYQLSSDDCLVSIDKEDPLIWEGEYDPDDYLEEETF